jgi:hypothetical protein
MIQPLAMPTWLPAGPRACRSAAVGRLAWLQMCASAPTAVTVLVNLLMLVGHCNRLGRDVRRTDLAIGGKYDGSRRG